MAGCMKQEKNLNYATGGWDFFITEKEEAIHL